jgi:hypothetical protein
MGYWTCRRWVRWRACHAVQQPQMAARGFVPRGVFVGVYRIYILYLE